MVCITISYTVLPILVIFTPDCLHPTAPDMLQMIHDLIYDKVSQLITGYTRHNNNNKKLLVKIIGVVVIPIISVLITKTPVCFAKYFDYSLKDCDMLLKTGYPDLL